MNRFSRSVCLLALMLAGPGVASALEIGGQVQDFQLFDDSGKTYQLSKRTDKKAVVLVTQGNGCPISRLMMPGLREIKTVFESRGVEVMLINPNLQDSAQAVAAESKEYGFEIPILLDKRQTVSEQLGVNRTAEIFVIDPKTMKLVYHGPMDDRLHYEAQRPARQHYLVDALEALLAGRPVAKPFVNSAGCLIDFPNRKS